jgi:hypothetical protein
VLGGCRREGSWSARSGRRGIRFPRFGGGVAPAGADLGHSYVGVPVLRGVNLEVQAGECLGLLGQNGAGKSTIINILSGKVRPVAGKLLLRGRDGTCLPADGAELRHRRRRPGVRTRADPVGGGQHRYGRGAEALGCRHRRQSARRDRSRSDAETRRPYRHRAARRGTDGGREAVDRGGAGPRRQMRSDHFG